MNIEIMTKKQTKELIKEEVNKQIQILYKELDKIIKRLNLLKEEIDLK